MAIPRQAKTSNPSRVRQLLDLGWKVSLEIKADNGETYEWLLDWEDESEPLFPESEPNTSFNTDALKRAG